MCIRDRVSTQSTWGINAEYIGRTVTREEKADSFFYFFTPPAMPDEDAELTPEQAEELETFFSIDYELGVILKEKLIPHAVLFYTGEAVEDDDDEFVDDEEDEEEDEEDEDESEGEGEGKDDEKPAECKQS
eukprot:TRINITY_DN3302_c0_g1_i4.p3 TRINITY_DN3302_c0_g1~~TRINITY_DN3302_c0_g1_i4.p3  ORF type:complete len:131 (-),score=51.44 TRINITY_DN3302_c0_g1_i4:165-557(-)